MVDNAFELAVFGQDTMRNRQRPSEIFENLRNLLLAVWIGITVKQADGEGMCLAGGGEFCDARDFGGAEFKRDLAVEQGALRDSNAHRTRHQRLRARRRQRIDVGAILPANLDQVFETGVGKQGDLGAAPLQQGIGGDGRTVGEQVRGVLANQCAQTLEHRCRRIMGGGKQLMDAQFAVDNCGDIGERTAGIDANDDRRLRGLALPRFASRTRHSQAVSRILNVEGSAARVSAASPSFSGKIPEMSRPRIDQAGAKRVKRGPEPAASRTDHFDFVDYQRCQVDPGGTGNRGLEDELAARANQSESAGETAGRTGTIHHHIEARLEPTFLLSGDAETGNPLKLVLMMAAEDGIASARLHRQCDHRAQTPVPKDSGAFGRINRGLLENLKGRSQWFSEYRGVVSNRIRNRNQILVGQAEILGEGAVASENSEHGALRAMASQVRTAIFTIATSGVDLSNDYACPPAHCLWYRRLRRRTRAPGFR